jgi:hypothetical protein
MVSSLQRSLAHTESEQLSNAQGNGARREGQEYGAFCQPIPAVRVNLKKPLNEIHIASFAVTEPAAQSTTSGGEGWREKRQAAYRLGAHCCSSLEVFSKITLLGCLVNVVSKRPKMASSDRPL